MNDLKGPEGGAGGPEGGAGGTSYAAGFSSNPSLISGTLLKMGGKSDGMKLASDLHTWAVSYRLHTHDAQNV